jgi:hypothetical protein
VHIAQQSPKTYAMARISDDLQDTSEVAMVPCPRCFPGSPGWCGT